MHLVAHGQVHRPEKVNRCTCPYDPAEEASSPRDSLSKLSSPLGSSLFDLITENKDEKIRQIFGGINFILYFCHIIIKNNML